MKYRIEGPTTSREVGADQVPDGDIGIVVGGDYCKSDIGRVVVGATRKSGSEHVKIIGATGFLGERDTRIRLLQPGESITITAEPE